MRVRPENLLPLFLHQGDQSRLPRLKISTRYSAPKKVSQPSGGFIGASSATSASYPPWAGATSGSGEQKSRAHQRTILQQLGHLLLQRPAAFRPLLTEGLAFSVSLSHDCISVVTIVKHKNMVHRTFCASFRINEKRPGYDKPFMSRTRTARWSFSISSCTSGRGRQPQVHREFQGTRRLALELGCIRHHLLRIPHHTFCRSSLEPPGFPLL